ncbi:MAG: glycosyltransferase family 1 protein [Clostridiaceae bacterium]
MIRVLVAGMTGTVGGLENFIMNYYRQVDKELFQFDFLCRFPRCAYQEEIERNGGRFFSVTRRSKNPFRYYREIHTFFRKHGHEYDVFWDNECMFNDVTPLQLARREGIPVRIAHSHNAGNMDTSPKGRLQGFLHRLQKWQVVRCATDLWACSDTAGAWAFPKRFRTGKKYRVVLNAIDTERFVFSDASRSACRKQLALGDHFTIGCVGRLQYQKNQAFLLEAFALFTKSSIGKDARLLLLGTGPDAEALQEQAVSLGIERSVMLIGYRPDTEHYLQAIDVFALPSRFEGLGIAVIEAQCSGLPCLVSQAVPTEAAVTDLVRFLPVENPAVWADAFSQLAENRPARYSKNKEINNAGYEISTAAKGLAELLKKRTGTPTYE